MMPAIGQLRLDDLRPLPLERLRDDDPPDELERPELPLLLPLLEPRLRLFAVVFEPPDERELPDDDLPLRLDEEPLRF